MYKNKFLKNIFLVSIFVGVGFLICSNLVHADSTGGIGGGGGTGGGDGSCFIAGTKITMEDGSKKVIEDVKVGDKVLGYDFINNKYLTNTVLELENPIRKEWFIIILDNKTILKTTDDHPIYIEKLNGYKGWGSIDPQATFKNSGWGMEVSQLQSGDYLKTENEELTQVISIFNIPKEIQTYNFKHVTNNNSFFAEGVLVHNKASSASCSTWSAWSTCSATTCGTTGTQTRSRTCGFCFGLTGIDAYDCRNSYGSDYTETETQTCNGTLPNDCAANTCIGTACDAGCWLAWGTKVCPVAPPVCVPSNNCQVDTCSNSTCYNGCETVPGSKYCPITPPICVPDNSCRANTCSYSTCHNGCQTVTGLKYCPITPPVCIPSNNCQVDTCSGSSCFNGCENVSGLKYCPIVTPPPTCSISISPSSIINGGSAIMSWSTTNASSMSINQGIGGVSISGGNRSISPSSNTTYSGTVSGPGGITSCSTPIIVTSVPVITPPPTCSISISPSSITNGGSATMSWSTTNASSLNINQGIGGVSIFGGSRNISPSSNTTYTGIVTGLGGTSSCSAPITVTSVPVITPAPSCSMSVSPASIAPGSSSTLTWTTTNVASASIDNSIGSVSNNGSTSVSPSSDTTYVGTFVGNNGTTINCSASILVSSVPITPTCSMNFSPTAVVTGGSSTLTWASTGATSGIIDNSIGSVTPNNSTSITPIGASTYTGIFTGPGGSATCSASISVSSTGCVTNCGGGGNNPPNVSLARTIFPGEEPEPIFVYLNQVPYTGFFENLFNKVKFIMVSVPNIIMAN